MITYSYSGSSPIAKVTFEKNDDGGLRAYLHAGAMTQAAMEKAAVDLQCDGYQNTPAERNGQATLEVRGFQRESTCLKVLEKHGLVSGAYRQDRRQEEKPTFLTRVKNQSLLTSGLLYVIGDIKFISYGVKGASPLNIAGGIFYALGTYFNLAFNRKSNADLKVHDVAQQMADEMNDVIGKIPAHSAMDRILDDKHKNFIQKADESLRHIPAELMVGSFAVAGACIAVAAAKQLGHCNISAGHIDEFIAKQMARAAKNPAIKVKSREEAEAYLKMSHKIENWLDVGLGSMTVVSGLIGAFIKEKAKDPDAPKKEGMDAWWEYVQQHPLMISGYGLMASTLCHAGSTALAYKNGAVDAKSAIMDRGTFVITNLMAEFLISISSKGHGEGVKSDPSIDESAINVAADLIARHPASEQPMLIEHMAKFLGRPDVLALDDAEATHKLQTAVEAMKKNPWALATAKKAPMPALPAWQAKMAASPENTLHLGV